LTAVAPEVQMHRFARVLCTGFLFGALALTAPVECSPGSLQSYFDLSSEGCSIDDKVIFGFAPLVLVANAEEIDPGSIFVTPLTTALQPGFRFDINGSADAGELLQSRLVFIVSVNPGGGPIARVRTGLDGSAATGDGNVTGVTDLCLGGEFFSDVGSCPTATDTLIVFNAGFDALLQESRGLSPVTTLGVINDIALDGGSSGSAGLSSFTIRFQEVPEPATFVPVIASLLALTFLRHRR
jgi:hypothetical protein